MQTPKTSGSIKSSSGSQGFRRINSRSVNSDTGDKSSSRVVRQLKTTNLEVNSCTSIRSPKISSPRFSDRASPKGPAPEKKRLGKVVELETQVTQLEDALRTVKDRLIVSESWKKQAKIDAQESRNEILVLTLRLEESQKILAQSRPSKEHDELEDEACKLNLESNQVPESADSSALAAALLEIDQLKVKVNALTESEATQTKQAESAYVEIRVLKENLSHTLSLMETMRNKLEDCKSSESRAQAVARETLLQLETAKKTMESFKLNSDEKCSQTSTIMVELKKSKDDIEELKASLMDKETELQCVLEENENLSTKLANMISIHKENESKQEMFEKSEENEKLKLEIKRLNGFMEALNQDFDFLKSKSTNLESDLCEKSNENEMLKQEIKKMNVIVEESKQDFVNLKSKSTNLEAELREKSNENEKLRQEIKKSNDDVAQVKISKSETEEELKKLKVQMGQWRKAAEAATAMLCDENGENNNDPFVDRTWSMGHFSPMKTPCSTKIDNDNDNDDDDDEFLKRKNGNVLKRIGVLWKKPQNN